MSINSNPIVLKDTNGNLKEASQTDLEYMAFQAGLRISSDVDSTQPYAINTDATTDDTLIGSFVDTFYNEPVGTHDGSSLTTGSTTTFLYQRESNEISTDELSTFRRPVADSDSGTSIVDMGDASMTTLSRELMKILQGDEMPGAFRLSSSAPSADWSASLPNVFSDTTTDGNVTSYSIYQRTSGTMPDSCSPMYVRRDDYGSRPLADYNGGLQAMTQEQVSVTFGQIVRKFFADGEVGTYQLRSSAQGAPTDTGTWEARGTAVDTRYTTESQQYSGQYSSFSSVQYSGDRSYTGEYTSAPVQFAGTRQFSGERDYAGQYVSPPIQFAGDRTFSGDRNYSGNYTSAPTQFAGVRTFSGARDFANQYTRTPQQFAGVRTFSGPRNFSNQYTRSPQQFAGVRQFAGSRNFAAQYTRSPQQFAGVRTFSGPRNFSGQYTRSPQQFAGPRTFSGSRPTARPAVLYQNFAGTRSTSYARPTAYYRPGVIYQNFTGTRQFAGYSINFRPGTTPGNFTSPSNFNGASPQINFNGPRPANFAGQPVVSPFARLVGPFPFGGGQQYATFTTTYFINPNPFIPGNVIVAPFSGVRVGGGYSGQRSIYYSGPRPGQYSGFRTWQFSGVRTWQFSGVRAFAGQRVVYYVEYFPFQYTSQPAQFGGNRNVQYLGYTTNYRPGILYQQFTGPRLVYYAGVVNQNFARSPTNFTGTRQFAGSRPATQNFTRPQQFTGTRQFAGSRPKGGQFSRPQQFTGTRQFAGSRPATQNFNQPQQFTGTRQFAGSRSATQNFARPQQFTGTRQFSGDRNYSGNYVGASQFAGPTQYSGVRTFAGQYDDAVQFTGTRQFSGVRTYSGDYAGSYTKQYTGQYAGDTLIDTSETIETFTLYVRVS
jgi:hypothetical protein